MVTPFTARVLTGVVGSRGSRVDFITAGYAMKFLVLYQWVRIGYIPVRVYLAGYPRLLTGILIMHLIKGYFS